MAEELSPAWDEDVHRRYTPADDDRTLEYVTYHHESGDLRLRIAPASLDGDDFPGYALTATAYPGLEFAESTRLRRVLRFDRCVAVARRFASLFDARYEGPGDLEDALAYASERVRASAANDAPAAGVESETAAKADDDR
ncbi:hypothetical protein [Salinilacihabitans rarus]|uniref:hypothetical protein n=1 Tax=Salinilacihabitans rarus TaxID=2961596 RepID=UPI0020C8D0B2|nr:hypothetical protein [Salinilacihabitans rarus]